MTLAKHPLRRAVVFTLKIALHHGGMMLQAMSKISYISLTFILCWIIYCATGQSVESQCRRQCNSILRFSSNEVNLFCSDDCKVLQCHSGCDKYSSALVTGCQQACGESIVQRQFCTQGCNSALDIYAQQVLDTLDNLPAPELKHGSKNYSSVVLHWSGPINENITYYIQSRVIDTNSGWQVYNTSTLQSNGDVNITGLHPYLTYKFKIVLVITALHLKDTAESEEIATLPHGAPSTAPTITDVSAPTPSVISISWRPPIFPNGRVLGYRLKLNPYNHPELHPVNREVPGNVTSWTLRQLQSSQLYLITVSAWNSEGEGPVDSANITTPNPGNLPAEEMPYLVLGEENKVLKQNMEDWHSKPGHLHTHMPPSVFVTGVGVHVRRELLLVTDSDGRVHQISMTNHSEDRMNIYPRLMNPTAITVDWLNDYVYVVNEVFIYRCLLDGNDCIVASEQLQTIAHDIKVDPVNGFLYFTQTGSRNGLYRIDLGYISPTHRATPTQVTNCKLTAFFMDHSNMQLYFPNETQNTILSSFLDGTGLVDLRSDKVVHPKFQNIVSMVYYRGLFYWTDGESVMKEDYDKKTGMFFHNSLLFFASHYASFNIYQPKVQPNPVPHSPPQNVQALFTSNKVNIRWQKPQKLSYQGKGAWDMWSYDVSVAEKDGSKSVVSQNISKSNHEKTGLLPDTVYLIKARACSMVGCGPWSHDFVGRTLPQESTSATVILSRTDKSGRRCQLVEISMYGDIIKQSPFVKTYSSFKDVTWSEDTVYLTTESKRMYSYNRETGRMMIMLRFLRQKVTSLAYDWLGKKLYWSIESGVIQRARPDMSAKEFVSQAKEGRAFHLAVDSLQGRLYWNTMYSVESSHLNGDDHHVYFSVPFFSGKLVVSLTLNFDLNKIFWYVKGYENQELYCAEMKKNSATWDDVFVQKVGNIKNIATMSSLQYYSHRLFWKGEDDAVVVGDLKCNHSSVISKPGTDVFSVYHASLQPYPPGLDKNTLVVVPSSIAEDMVQCHGHWTLFNVTWKPAAVNYGKVFYEVSIKILDGSKANTLMFQKLENTWYEVSDVPPYSHLSVSLRAYTYWGNGAVTTVEIHSPMSVPGKPRTPRVYVTQYKDMLTSQNSLAADFRWTEPEVANGIISHYNVYHWLEGEEEVSVTMATSARHFIMSKLMQNSTYYFQVSACTEIGCGERSDIVSAQADVVKPVPKLLVATNEHILETEVDTESSSSVTGDTEVFPVSLAYLANDKRIFWISKDNKLMQYVKGSQQELVQLNGTGVDLSLDWISHTLYVVEYGQTSGKTTIGEYRLDQNIYFNIQPRPQHVGCIVADPYTSTIIWTEAVLSASHYVIYKMNANEDISVVFHSQRSRRELSTRNCNCPMSMYVGPQIAVDHSQDDLMGILMYDTASKFILSSDIDGCHCRNIIHKDKVTKTGDGPDILSVDHLHVYWYSNTDNKLYSIEKSTGKVLAPKSMPNVKDLVAYGSQLQPLPSVECLNPRAYNGSIVMVKNTNSTITVLLEEITWPQECEKISHPDTKYTIYYKVGSTGDRCGIGGSDCMSESSYERQITLTGLEPYTEYVVHGAVSNYYTEYLSKVLSDGHIYRTKVGVPSPVTSLNVDVIAPFAMNVSWSPPAQPNGPLSDISYKVKWSVESGGELQEKEMVPVVETSGDAHHLPTYIVILTKLLSNHVYKVKVLASNKDHQYYSESRVIEARTYQTPENVRLVNRTADSLILGWRSPSDNSVYKHHFFYKQVNGDSPGGWTLYVYGKRLNRTTNYTDYNITIGNLLPYTDYAIVLKLLVVNNRRAITVPPQNQPDTIFRTLASVPNAPSPPEIVTLKSQAYEVVWTEPVVNGIGIDHYVLQFRTEDSNTWNDAYNGTDIRWVVDRDITVPGQDYYFRVKARNEIGWGLFSNSSLLFTFRETQVPDDSVAVIAITLSFVFIVIVIIIMSVCYVMHRRKEKRKPTQFIAIARGPDMELATLRELPHTAFQQSNTLYAINIIPTDSDIASLPHFRRDQLMLTKFLGSGAFGEVFEGLAKNILSDSSGETKVAVKTLRKSASDHEKEEFLKEAVLMSNFRHEHILSLLGVCLDNDPQFIILELMEGGDLLSFLRTCRPSTTNAAFLCLMDLVKICVHVARGCKYLEEMHFVHRDLAARNCLVSSKTPANMVVKIGDFGLARDIYKNDYYRKEGEGLLPVRWMSPEALVDGVFTTQSDIWAFGVLMWEVMTFGRQPYPARTNIEVLHFVRSGGQLDQPDGCPEDMFELMQSCWTDAEGRPSFSSVLQQLEEFLEKCNALFADYIVPIRSRNTQPDVAGYTHRHQTRERRASLRTSSLGHDPDQKVEDEVLYKKIHHATSFDSPEPHEETDAELTCQRIAMQNSVCTDYLIPHTQGTPNYLEIIQDPMDRRLRKSSQGSSRHSSCSSDIYAHSLNSNLQVALPPLKQYESIHSIDSENPNYSRTETPFTMVSSIPEGYEIVPFPSHLNKGSLTVPEGYSFVRGPPRQVQNKHNVSMPEGYSSVNSPPKYISDKNIPVPSGYTMVNIPVKRSCPMGSSSSAEVVLDYPKTSVERGCSSAEAKLYYAASPSEVANNFKNKSKHFYPLADSRNYVDCNRNKASYLSLSSKGSDCSVAHITQNMDIDGPLVYWASSNSSRHPSMQQEYNRHLVRSRGQVYPVNETVVSGYPDLHASLV